MPTTREGSGFPRSRGLMAAFACEDLTPKGNGQPQANLQHDFEHQVSTLKVSDRWDAV